MSHNREVRRNFALIAVEGVDGAGKSTLVRGLVAALDAGRDAGGGRGALLARPCREMVGVFRALIETRDDESVLYQDAIPGDLRHSLYVIENLLQFRYQGPLFEQYDAVVFDRWLQTNAVYCGPVEENRAWYARLADAVPRPDVLFWLRVDPDLAYRRLVERSDRWTRVYSPRGLRDKLEGLCAGYEREMLGAGAVVLDGAAPPEEVLARATAVLAEHGLPVPALSESP
ncbi:thymidylate kinase [Microbispora sp. H11081]|uniref:thymidylate kinase n=1 Tax=Microbispora sp. H11081 TaxID=2729107 RepID=UPI0014751CFB|nr:thymidylate kinase [Microbispora sp. H11081]